MADHSAIEWTDATWNPIVGCSIVSPGCTNCYAMKMAARLQKMNRTGGSGTAYVNHYDGTTKKVNGKPVWTGKIAIAPEHLFYAPLSWRKPRRIFVNSMGDLFHEDVPRSEIARAFGVMIAAHHLRGHTLQVLTKRADLMQATLSDDEFWAEAMATVDMEIMDRVDPLDRRSDDARATCGEYDSKNPPPGIWLGVSAEDQVRADERIPALLATPAAVRFVSYEPALGPIDLTHLKYGGMADLDCLRASFGNYLGKGRPRVDWIICGGESGPGARPMLKAWAESMRDQCAAAGVAFFKKQWGEWIDADEYFALLRQRAGDNADLVGSWPVPLNLTDAAAFAAQQRLRFEHYSDGSTMLRVGKHAAGRLLDGVEYSAFPEARR